MDKAQPADACAGIGAALKRQVWHRATGQATRMGAWAQAGCLIERLQVAGRGRVDGLKNREKVQEEQE